MESMLIMNCSKFSYEASQFVVFNFVQHADLIFENISEIILPLCSLNLHHLVLFIYIAKSIFFRFYRVLVYRA